MALPAGVTHITNIKGDKGDKGDTGTIAYATAVSVPAGSDATVEMVGPETSRGAIFEIPRGLPGVNAIENDAAVAAYVDASDSETSQALARRFAIYPPQDWETVEEESVVENPVYPYGDVRRYGCPCNGVDDDSPGLQIAFDVCGLKGVPIIKPAGVEMLLENPIVLQPMATHRYTFTGVDDRTDASLITCRATEVFVGSNYYSTPAGFTDVAFNMSGLVFSCTRTVPVTVFKALEIRGSLITDNKFYTPYILLEGAFQWWARFERNRVQHFTRSLVTSSATLPGVTLDQAKQALETSGYNFSEMANYLVQGSTGSTSTYSRYARQSNDSFMRNNYFAGTTAQNKPSSLLEIDSIDVDFVIEGNWVEFLEYVVKPCLRTNTITANQFIYGTEFRGNEFQIVYRFFEENTLWSGWSLENNSFTSFASASLFNRLPNVVNPKWDTKKCGVLVFDRTEESGRLMSTRFTNNRWRLSDYGIYLDCGTATLGNTVVERNTQHPAGTPAVTNPIYVRQYKDPGSSERYFTENWFDLLNNRVLPTLPDVGDVGDGVNNFVNMFNGQHTMVDGQPYLSVISSGGRPTYRALS